MIQRRQKKINIFPELFPQFVLKLDDHFEEDFSSLAEDVGLEDLDIGADAFRQTAILHIQFSLDSWDQDIRNW